VEEDPHGPQFGQLLRLLDEVLRLARVARAVDEAGVELALRAGDRLAASRRFETSFSGSWSRKTSIPLSRARGDEAAREVAPTGREPTRNGPRSAIASGVFVRALSARIRSHGLSTPARTAAVEDAAARDLEVGEAGAVEISASRAGPRRHPARQRLLRQQPDRRVDKRGHRDPGALARRGEPQAREM
jgi:hypothetical protein